MSIRRAYEGLVNFLTSQVAILDIGAPREHASMSHRDFYCGDCNGYHRLHRFACSLCGDIKTGVSDVQMTVAASIALDDAWNEFREKHRHPE